ncbi:transporter substrate-binding protein [Bradyrhizobium liaoningense]|uniref:transporter substrate-binding protein n=1 Tax=Bradyrhizobium liaoningense TaxID=43992 RepID=UPI0004B7B13E|nr:transporter substrate-binding protein [Bradyrhizobium liaoningense]
MFNISLMRAACAALLFCLPNEVDAQDTIKLGILHSLSGPLATREAPLKDAMLMLIQQQNQKGGVNGKKLEAIVVDPASNYPLFSEKARELIDKEKVVAIFGCWTSASRKAVLPVIKGSNNILFYPAPYEGNEFEPNVFYLGAAPDQLILPTLDYLVSPQGGAVRHFVLVTHDSYGVNRINSWAEWHLKSLGMKPEDILKHYVPLGQPDWRATVADIQKVVTPGNKTAVILTIADEDGARLLRELRQQQFSNNLIVTTFPLGDADLDAAAALPDQIVALNYLRTDSTLANQEFVARWRSFTNDSKRNTNAAMAAHAIGFAMWVKAVEKIKTTEPEKVRAALVDIEVPNLTGESAKMLPNHHISQPLFVSRPRASLSQPFDVVTKVIPDANKHCGGAIKACGPEAGPVRGGSGAGGGRTGIGGDAGGGDAGVGGQAGQQGQAGQGKEGQSRQSQGGMPTCDPAASDYQQCLSKRFERK